MLCALAEHTASLFHKLSRLSSGEGENLNWITEKFRCCKTEAARKYGSSSQQVVDLASQINASEKKHDLLVYKLILEKKEHMCPNQLMHAGNKTRLRLEREREKWEGKCHPS
jgi:hypothetical protein